MSIPCPRQLKEQRLVSHARAGLETAAERGMARGMAEEQRALLGPVPDLVQPHHQPGTGWPGMPAPARKQNSGLG